MRSSFRPDPAEFARCVDIIHRRIEEMAIRTGVPEHACVDLAGLLAALPPFARDRAAVMLAGVRIHAVDDHPAMSLAAGYVLTLARDVWDRPTAVSSQSSPGAGRMSRSHRRDP